jgi:hypothetical protein
MMKIWNWLKGKKTYIISAIGLLYGVTHGDTNATLISLTGFGLRSGLQTIAETIIATLLASNVVTPTQIQSGTVAGAGQANTATQ